MTLVVSSVHIKKSGLSGPLGHSLDGGG